MSGIWGRLAPLTYTEAAQALSRRPVLLVPVGATEAHGPHLPLDTDVRLSLELADRAAAALGRAGRDAWVAPALAYAVTDYASPFPGTVTVRPATLSALVVDVCLSLACPGAPAQALEDALREGRPAASVSDAAPAAVVLVNSHLELAHVRVLRDAVERLAAVSPVPVLFPDHTRRRWVSTLSAEFQSGSCHAGAYETSLMLAAAPGAVRPGFAQLPEIHVDLPAAMREGRRSFVDAGAEDAYCGAPAAASAQEGEESFAALVRMIVTTVEEALGPAGGGASP